MIRTILSLILLYSINAFNCDVKQIHMAQGIDSTSMTISWLTVDNCFSHVIYGKNNKSLENIYIGSSSTYDFQYNKMNASKYYKSGYIHHVLITDLEPSTLYYYQCGDLHR